MLALTLVQERSKIINTPIKLEVDVGEPVIKEPIIKGPAVNRLRRSRRKRLLTQKRAKSKG